LEQDSTAREAGPEASGDAEDDVDSGERMTRRGCSQSTVMLSDSSDEDEATTADQPTGGDAAASTSRDLEEKERQACLEAECRSKFNVESASQQLEMEAPHGKGPAGETSTPPPPASALPGKGGWVECDAS
jgi:hypothetical protein